MAKGWSREGRTAYETRRRLGSTLGVKPRILVVEDEEAISEPLAESLEREGFAAEVVGTLELARAAFGREPPDLILLDVMLPDGDGRDLAREIRKGSDVPIVMLTARGEEIDRVLGLELGADDYVVKPFSPKELVARVRAVLRRTRTAERDEVLRAGDVEIDTGKMRASVAGAQVELTPTEFQLLATLVREPGRVFTRSQLLDAVHGVAIESYERAIDAHVKNIRRKIEPTPGSPRYVLTVHGVGYRFADA
jgi:DNA-binding response OmpR family regulator